MNWPIFFLKRRTSKKNLWFFSRNITNKFKKKLFKWAESLYKVTKILKKVKIKIKKVSTDHIWMDFREGKFQHCCIVAGDSAACGNTKPSGYKLLSAWLIPRVESARLGDRMDVRGLGMYLNPRNIYTVMYCVTFQSILVVSKYYNGAEIFLSPRAIIVILKSWCNTFLMSLWWCWCIVLIKSTVVYTNVVTHHSLTDSPRAPFSPVSSICGKCSI